MGLLKTLNVSGGVPSKEWYGPSEYKEARQNCNGIVMKSSLAVGCNDGTKQHGVANMVKWFEENQNIKIPHENVWLFDDRAENILPFNDTGSKFNARQISCRTREPRGASSIGYCGPA